MTLRQPLAALAALATAAPASAAAQQASAELGMLVAGQSSNGGQASFGAFDLRLDAGWLRDSPPAEDRGLSFREGDDCCFEGTSG